MNLKIYILPLFILLFNCSESKYSKLVKAEMAKKTVNDSLFFGMKFGETKQDFFDQCWKLNKQKIISHGSSNNFVKYILPLKNEEDKVNTITMLFYGIFNDEKIMTGMDMKFYYESWSLWNKSYHSDKLLPLVKDSLKSWFPGNDFINVPIKETNEILYVKIDGNRRIVIEPLKSDKEVDVRIDNLRHILNEKL